MAEVKICKTVAPKEEISYLAWVNYIQTELMKTQEKNLKTTKYPLWRKLHAQDGGEVICNGWRYGIVIFSITKLN